MLELIFPLCIFLIFVGCCIMDPVLSNVKKAIAAQEKDKVPTYFTRWLTCCARGVWFTVSFLNHQVQNSQSPRPDRYFWDTYVKNMVVPIPLVCWALVSRYLLSELPAIFIVSIFRYAIQNPIAGVSFFSPRFSAQHLHGRGFKKWQAGRGAHRYCRTENPGCLRVTYMGHLLGFYNVPCCLLIIFISSLITLQKSIWRVTLNFPITFRRGCHLQEVVRGPCPSCLVQLSGSLSNWSYETKTSCWGMGMGYVGYRLLYLNQTAERNANNVFQYNRSNFSFFNSHVFFKQCMCHFKSPPFFWLFCWDLAGLKPCVGVLFYALHIGPNDMRIFLLSRNISYNCRFFSPHTAFFPTRFGHQQGLYPHMKIGSWKSQLCWYALVRFVLPGDFYKQKFKDAKITFSPDHVDVRKFLTTVVNMLTCRAYKQATNVLADQDFLLFLLGKQISSQKSIFYRFCNILSLYVLYYSFMFLFLFKFSYCLHLIFACIFTQEICMKICGCWFFINW